MIRFHGFTGFFHPYNNWIYFTLLTTGFCGPPGEWFHIGSIFGTFPLRFVLFGEEFCFFSFFLVGSGKTFLYIWSNYSDFTRLYIPTYPFIGPFIIHRGPIAPFITIVGGHLEQIPSQKRIGSQLQLFAGNIRENTGMYTSPENERMSPEKEPFQRESNLNQPSFLRGEPLFNLLGECMKIKNKHVWFAVCVMRSSGMFYASQKYFGNPEIVFCCTWAWDVFCTSW